MFSVNRYINKNCIFHATLHSSQTDTLNYSLDKSLEKRYSKIRFFFYLYQIDTASTNEVRLVRHTSCSLCKYQAIGFGMGIAIAGLVPGWGVLDIEGRWGRYKPAYSLRNSEEPVRVSHHKNYVR